MRDFPEPLLLRYPATIRGAISVPGDHDRAEFFLPSERDIRISPWPLSRFTFDCRIASSDGQVITTIPGFDHHVVHLSSGTWSMEMFASLSPDPLPPPPPRAPPLPPVVPTGAYEVTLRDSEPKGWQWGAVDAPRATGESLRLIARTTTLAGADRSPTEVRFFWVTKFGFVGSVPYSPVAIFDWKPPPGITGTYGYRAQLFSNSIPISDVTPAVWFFLGSRSRSARH